MRRKEGIEVGKEGFYGKVICHYPNGVYIEESLNYDPDPHYGFERKLGHCFFVYIYGLAFDFMTHFFRTKEEAEKYAKKLSSGRLSYKINSYDILYQAESKKLNNYYEQGHIFEKLNISNCKIILPGTTTFEKKDDDYYVLSEEIGRSYSGKDSVEALAYAIYYAREYLRESVIAKKDIKLFNNLYKIRDENGIVFQEFPNNMTWSVVFPFMVSRLYKLDKKYNFEYVFYQMASYKCTVEVIKNQLDLDGIKDDIEIVRMYERGAF